MFSAFMLYLVSGLSPWPQVFPLCSRQCIWWRCRLHDHKFSLCAANNGMWRPPQNWPELLPWRSAASGRHLHCGMDSVSRWSGLRGMGVVQSSSILFLLHNIQILRCHAIYRMFPGNLQKWNWKMDISLGALGAQNLFSSLYKLGVNFLWIREI